MNSDLVGKVVNLASRTAKFVEKTGLSAKYPDDGGLFAAAAAAGDEIAAAYEACDFNQAMRLIMALADRANPFVEENKPWELRKDPASAERLQDVCTVALESVPPAGDLPRAGAAEAGRADGRAAERADHQLGPGADAARRHAGRQVHPHAQTS